MRNRKQLSKKILLILIAFLGLAIVVALLVKAFYIPTKTYHSKLLKVTFEYPSNYQLEEKFTNIVLKNSQGQIVMSRSGTNYKKLNEHIDNLSRLNHFTILNKIESVINGQESISGQIGKDKYYFIYSNEWTIFSLSTNVQSLYPDLDQIAKTFRYER